MDRCDRCNAQAFFHATKGKMSLHFCMHHGRDNHDQLVLDGWAVKDDTARINKKPSVSGAM